MPIKPYRRMIRGMKDGPNSGYSGSAFITDPDYANSPSHYVRAFELIQADLRKIFEYVEPSICSSRTYSFRIHELLMRTCIEVEANFKAILTENKFTPKKDRFGQPVLHMGVYKMVNVTHHLSSYEVMLPIWNGPRKIWRPFEGWSTGNGLTWYNAYNSSKHDRHEEFRKANMNALVEAVAGLLVLLSSQFKGEDFSAGAIGLSVSGYDYHEMEPAIGSLFRIKYPDDWLEDELYDFDWQHLQGAEDRFQKFDYDAF